ncbi:cysteine-rich repeat secretory protein 38 [Ziziphus jujuba]|uniref:Cysteine-rich repeat secretory protein 38 n=1 Tax=Ziziphus jujuba TaxID=326968 RepID=A0A6P3YXM1_ZIZJJ|nr:cysteine-rich repeat secretory protein 38 [Ziziphus jujuba]
MSCSKPIPFAILLFCVFLHSANAAGPLYHFCFSSQNYTANSPFGANLNTLLNLLSVQVPPSGFGVDSTGQNENKVNGLALCRGDVSSTDCKTCIIDASKELKNRCPYNKGAIIWYDNCLLKYSDSDFFGQIDNQNKFYMWNVQDVENPESFNPKVKELLSSLSYKASATSKLFATGELELEKSEKLYGLAQCTRDISSDDCKKCLDGAISELPNCCSGKRGGRVVGGSCNVRYELYPIVATTY